MSAEDDFLNSTDAIVAAPWLDESGGEVAAVLHLVVACFVGEPGRVGHSARLDRPGFVGRRHDGSSDEAPIAFVEQRPGVNVTTKELTTTIVSRRQLQITPKGADRVLVENTGKRPLYVNGELVGAALVQAGDTLMLEHVAVFVVEPRPVTLPSCVHYRNGVFPFGSADEQGMVGESWAAWALREQLGAAAAADSHVLLLGETGAGKEVAAGVLHGLSARGRGQLVARNAATIPGTLLDAELFGNAKNYPNTGMPEREGLIGAAHGGHLMLDEIGELPDGHQAHLLRVLDSSGQYQRLGETRERVSDFRLIAATNRDASALKHDFLARFKRRVAIPGLNQRRSDVPFLLRELLARSVRQTPLLVEQFLDNGDPSRARIEPRLVEALLRHPYREHTRELDRLLHTSITTSRGKYLSLTPEVLAELAGSESAADSPSSDRAGDDAQTGADEVRRALEKAGGSMNEAAELLGISRHALRRLMKAHGLVKRFD